MDDRKYVFYEDAGHGWLAVPRVDLVRLGLTDDISAFSRQRGGMVYLEEDSDESKFNMAYQQRFGRTPTTKTKRTEWSPIRSYSYYGW
jgi:hypothetical protein